MKACSSQYPLVRKKHHMVLPSLIQSKIFCTLAQVPVLKLYRFLTTFTVQSGSNKGKPLLDGNAVSNQGFLYVVMRADYSNIYDSYVKGKMHYVTTLLSKTNANGRFSTSAIYYSYIPLL